MIKRTRMLYSCGDIRGANKCVEKERSDRLMSALIKAHELLIPHEKWDRECPMNKEAEFNATILEPIIGGEECGYGMSPEEIINKERK